MGIQSMGLGPGGRGPPQNFGFDGQQGGQQNLGNRTMQMQGGAGGMGRGAQIPVGGGQPGYSPSGEILAMLNKGPGPQTPLPCPVPTAPRAGLNEKSPAAVPFSSPAATQLSAARNGWGAWLAGCGPRWLQAGGGGNGGDILGPQPRAG